MHARRKQEWQKKNQTTTNHPLSPPSVLVLDAKINVGQALGVHVQNPDVVLPAYEVVVGINRYPDERTVGVGYGDEVYNALDGHDRGLDKLLEGQVQLVVVDLLDAPEIREHDLAGILADPDGQGPVEATAVLDDAHRIRLDRLGDALWLPQGCEPQVQGTDVLHVFLELFVDLLDEYVIVANDTGDVNPVQDRGVKLGHLNFVREVRQDELLEIRFETACHHCRWDEVR